MAHDFNQEFAGTERFTIRRRLGTGGMGVVYEAMDHRRGVPVALKTLRNIEPADIYRLKREFRALAEVSHPSLVTLHELISVGQQWFFTMELVDGVSFLDYVRPAQAGYGSRSEEDTVRTPPPSTGETPPADLERLRSALRGLAEGVFALHEAGKLHRDIKPSNVLVRRDGRVVLLDFGLVTELDGRSAAQSTDQHIVGTAAYMAPEQAAAQPLGPPSDWYAVGAMLFQALTGEPPFRGSPIQVLLDKQRLDPPPPAELIPAVPSDLNALCVELLRREPERRPSGAEVLRRLGAAAPPQAAAPPRVFSPLVGRERHLSTLREALAVSGEGRTSIAFVQGRSGMGKTALVRRFLEELSESTIVLAGRCYERESVPYKAVDSLVDALSRHLARMEPLQAEALLPRDISALARMFPVLRRVEAVERAPRKTSESVDPQEVRRRALFALRELLGRISDRAQLVLFIDDLQWGDADSASLLAEVLRPPDTPVLLFIACYRSEDAAATRLTDLLIPALAEGSMTEVREVEVEPLSKDESVELALALLGEGSDPRVEAIAKESGGNPFFIDELVRYARAEPAGELAEVEVTLERVLLNRVARLAEPARRLLEVVAVAGGPLTQAAASRAAHLDGGGLTETSVLRAAHLIRLTYAGEREALETYHDRIRETVVSRLGPELLRERHLSLARALEQERGDPQLLAAHYRAAGEPEKAQRFALAAARRAAETLAFDRAVTLFRLAIELHPAERAGRRALLVLLGDALATAGRGREAAQAYLEAARLREGAPLLAAEAVELKRRAAEQLLRSGHIDEGLGVLRSVMAVVGMRLAKTPGRAAGALLWRRAHAALRGTRFRERDASQVSAEELTRIDLCWSIALGLAVVDTIRGASFQTRHLLLALKAGEPYRVCRALAAEAAYVSSAGEKAERRSAKLIGAARALARRSTDPLASGLVTFCEGLSAFFTGRWKVARERCEEAERSFRELGGNVTWEAANAQLFSLWSLFYLGDLGVLSRRIPALLLDAQERGNQYVVTSLRCGLANVARVSADDPAGAKRQVLEEMGRWSHQAYHVQHCWSLLALGMIDLYCGRGGEGWERTNREWPRLRRSFLLRVQNLRVEAFHLRARTALAAAAEATGARRRALLRAGEADARELAKEGARWARGLATLLCGSLAAARGKAEEGASLLEAAEEGLGRADMPHFAAAAKWRRGELIGGSAGQKAILEAEQWFIGQRVRRPANMVRMLAP